MKKRILIITDNIKTQINGVVTTYANIEKFAKQNNYIVDYIDPTHFKYFSAPGYPEVKLSFPVRMGKRIKLYNPDYIHVATEGPIGIAAKIWLDRNKWRYTTSYHTRFPEFLKRIYGIPLLVTRPVLRWFHKKSSCVFVPTMSIKDELETQGYCNLYEWTRGVDTEYLKPKQTFKKNIDKPVVLYVGRVSKEKNLDKLCSLQYDYDVRIVGDGPYREDLEQVYNHVKFLGYKRGSELADQYAQADVFVFPSRTDTFGIVIIEAMSQGTPVAAYPVPGPIDIIEQGITGHLSENLKSAIEQCLDLDRDVIKEKSKNWTWDRCWRIFENNLIAKR